jgi:glutamine cyclotransferase
MTVLLLLTVSIGCARLNPDPKGYDQVTRAQILSQTGVPVCSYRILRTYPHDPTSYTEGLVLHRGILYEGTGLYGQSKLRSLDLDTGAVIREKPLGPQYFGEGIAVLGDEIYQLTYQSNVGFVYDSRTFEMKRSFRYPTQGWGLTTDGMRLIMSNGSAALVFIDPASMKQTGYVVVMRPEGAVGFLNELEYINGRVYANVWQTDLIAVASPDSGRVLAWIDLTGLNPEPRRLGYPYVLNGIARGPHDGTLLVTGKNWPGLYEIELVPSANAPEPKPCFFP